MKRLAEAAGRDPESIGIESWVNMRGLSESEWRGRVETWRGQGATHMSVNTMNAGFDSPQGHIDAIRRFKEVAEG